jgi:phospholipase C
MYRQSLYDLRDRVVRSSRLILGACLIILVALAIRSSPGQANDIHKIKHVIIIMQENRSFDSYFGTFPGADGIPSGVCVPDPRGGCIQPYHVRKDSEHGGPHGGVAAVGDIDGGRMDGFIGQSERATPFYPYPGDVMGYHDGREIPNYWAYAKNFVLHDRMFEPNASYSLPAHLFAVSEWSARCTAHNDPSTCTNALNNQPDPTYKNVIWAWTDLTYLLHRSAVSWGYYVLEGTEPDCADDEQADCIPVKQNATTPGMWNPLPFFDTVKEDGELGNVQTLENFVVQAQQGTLPAVSWITPSNDVSEHPPNLVSAGQTYVTFLINTIMKGPNWQDCAIFLVWDDWGGFYDHVVPITVDENGYGLRVPSMVISPYAKQGLIDHQTLSFDAYVKFIEDDFLSGQRLDPATDGRPDPRPTVRENLSQLGDLRQDFNFNQNPRKPFILPLDPKTDLTPPDTEP